MNASLFQTPSSNKRPILLEQIKLLTDEILQINPFFWNIIVSDMEDANEETNIIESNEEIDEV